MEKGVKREKRKINKRVTIEILLLCFFLIDGSV